MVNSVKFAVWAKFKSCEIFRVLHYYNDMYF